MSTAATASISGGRAPKSNTVRRPDVVAKPLRTTTSPARSDALRTATPANFECFWTLGNVTSIGLIGGKSSPCSHAAVRPENAAPVGRRRSTAARISSGLSLRPAHTYHPKESRRQLAPRSCRRVRPARSASTKVNGPPMRAAGTVGKPTSCTIATLATAVNQPRQSRKQVQVVPLRPRNHVCEVQVVPIGPQQPFKRRIRHPGATSPPLLWSLPRA